MRNQKQPRMFPFWVEDRGLSFFLALLVLITIFVPMVHLSRSGRIGLDMIFALMLFSGAIATIPQRILLYLIVAVTALEFTADPAGDPNPAMVLADLVQPSAVRSSADQTGPDQRPDQPSALPRQQAYVLDDRPPIYKPIDVEPLKKAEPAFTVVFTEDKNSFYINGRKYAPDASPMTTARVGSYQHWRVLNRTAELHPFHIHQVHFLAYAENDVPLAHAEWLDTVNVPVGGSADVILDFTDPIIQGMSVFHCHLLNHEDKGMMAKILFK
jgi:suppressor of ftsI